MTITQPQHTPSVLPASFVRFRQVALLCGIAGLLLGGLGMLFGTVGQFFRAYLYAYLFWLAFALGSLAWMGIIHLTGGGWGRVVLRIAEAAATTLPLFALLFVPLLFGLHLLFPWATPDEVQRDIILQHKSRYLNIPFFIIRALFYFLLWTTLAFRLARGSRRYDETLSDDVAASNRALSSFTLVLLIATVTLAGVDWIMSREAHWYSSVLGFIIVVGHALSALLLLVIVVCLLAEHPPLKGRITPGHFNDLGNLMLTCVILWAYLSFAQLLISWTGNMQDEVKWYYPRMIGHYRWVGAALIVGHFFVPFFLLLMRDIKGKAQRLMKVAAVLLLFRLLDAYWLIAPTGTAGGRWFGRIWMDLWAPIGIGGLFLAAFLWQLERRPLLPRPELNRSLGEEPVTHDHPTPDSMNHGDGHAPQPA